MNIKILSFGKIDKSSYGDDIERYLKMAKPWSSVESVVLKSRNVSSEEQKERVLEAEGEMLRKKWPNRSFVCSLAEEGKLMTTLEFAEWLEKISKEYTSIVFNFGSAYGLHSTVKDDSDMLLSLSPMTMPFKLSRLVFVEQLYRALAVMNRHPYHKD